MAKDLIRTRHQITKFYGLKSQLQGISLRIQVGDVEDYVSVKSRKTEIAMRLMLMVGCCRCMRQTLKSTQAMAEAMKGVTKAMGQMNRQLNLPALQKIMQEFEMQNEKMEMTTEVMGDAIDDALEGDEEEEETDELVSQVLDEIGVDLDTQVTQLSLYNCVIYLFLYSSHIP
jgi:charged multivesicular body protein 2A